MEEFKIHSVETVSEVSQKSSVKIVTYVKRKMLTKGKANLKNIAGQVLTYNSKNFHWLNKKLDLERTMSQSGKPFLKKSDKKTENQSQNAASENKKPLARNVNLILTKH